MAHFYSTIQGHRGKATRCGTKDSGIYATASGWNIGGAIEIKYNDTLQTDVVYLYTTGGSNNHYRNLIGVFALDKDGNQYLVNTAYPELFI